MQHGWRARMGLLLFAALLVAEVVLPGCKKQAKQLPPVDISFPERVRAEDQWMRVEVGMFEMGSPDSEPGRHGSERLHTVRLTRPFLIQATEVTQKQWKELMGTSPSRWGDEYGDRPVERVSWWDAVAYCNALSDAEGVERCYEMDGCTGKPGGGCPDPVITVDCRGDYTCASVRFRGLGCKGYRLPTEAEWEYAARAGTTGERYGKLDRVAWHSTNSGRTVEVGRKQPNAWGLHDMHGNVGEWCWDWHEYDYPAGGATDPTGADSGTLRSCRGGTWANDAHQQRAAMRFHLRPDRRTYLVGFRPVRSIP